ncbi:monofunctional biosynthetic peptidoglycan transglycosylase [sulfur-oxidizing endosymbiont of Gigantopelta aegis]|uniref:monofunctional biosynthetic peptidoglycan transglycosylase n=1 Tax=sulfur-oxidizing endosymbiont of Gigantopelta aegis TaxID=2794934 RepID=UPI0018DB72D9|nr:monofunctional biosynthetic peptidoglycan transglycosylase [sulfur-oxidizing endosymbiont of Gigantopelta aegis]
MKRIFTYLLKKILWLLLGAGLISILLVTSLQVINPPTWGWKLQRQIMPPDNFPDTKGTAQIQHQWLVGEKISSNMKLAVIAAEDQLFSQHSGFDFDSILMALDSNAQGKPVRGASTISQQTAKNLFLWPSKSLVRKGIEAWFTILLEVLLDKSRILELYLNLVEFGPGIFGVEAASQHYFHKSAAKLTHNEAARLAAVLPNPYRYHVQQPSQYTRKRVRWIEQQMRQLSLAALPKR